MRDASTTEWGIVEPIADMPHPLANEALVRHAPVASNRLLGLFQELRSREFLFVVPGGNHGDELIWFGAEKLARLAGLRYRSMNHAEFMACSIPESAVVYIHGGGGYVPWCSGAPIVELRRSVTEHAGTVILGPETFTDDEEFLRGTLLPALDRRRCERVVLFAREEVSFATVQAIVPCDVSVVLEHDTALNLTAGDFSQYRLRANGGRGGYQFWSVREDNESPGADTPGFLAVWFDPAMHCRTFREWLDVHASAREIITNRLHSAIIGSILGIPTTLTRNSSHKCRAVWEFSLRDRGVRWAEALPRQRFSCLLGSIPPIKWGMASHKVRRCIRWLRGCAI